MDFSNKHNLSNNAFILNLKTNKIKNYVNKRPLSELQAI